MVAPLPARAQEPTVATEIGNIPIFVAIEKGDVQRVVQLLHDDPTQANLYSPSEQPVLMFAVFQSVDTPQTRDANLTLLKLLLNAHANPNAPDGYWRTPLWVATSLKRTDIVRLLMDHGADANINDLYGISPLRKADAATFAVMLHHGAKTDVPGRDGLTYLSEIVQHDGRKEIVADLLKRGINVNSRDADGTTPLIAAIRGDTDVTDNVYGASSPRLGFAESIRGFGTTRGDQSNPAIALLLIQNGADLNLTTSTGETALHFAAQQLSPSLNDLLQAGADPNRRNASGDLPLHLLLRRLDVSSALPQFRVKFDNKSYFGHIQNSFSLFSYLRELEPQVPKSALAGLIARSNLDTRDRFGVSPLILAVLARQTEGRALINAHHPPLNAVDQLFNAIADDDVITVAKLLRKTPRLVEARLPNGTTPLHVAALWSAPKVAELLLKKGADPNTHDANGETPLLKGALHATGRFAASAPIVARLLLAHGANPNVRDANQSTPLHLALRVSNGELAIALAEGGADPNALDNTGQVALHMVPLLPKGADTKLASLLIAHGANINQRDLQGDVPLMNAVVAVRLELVKVLLSHGAKVNVANESQESPLDGTREFSYEYSNRYGTDRTDQLPVAEALLKSGSDPNRPSAIYGRSLLTQAVHLPYNKDIIPLLLRYQADPNAVNSSLDSPLYAAVEENRKDLVALFLEQGADPLRLVTNTGNPKVRSDTPLALAQREGKQEILTLLQAQINALNTKK